MEQAARRARVRVVIHAEKTAVNIKRQVERVPEPRRHADEARAIGVAAVDVAALAAAGERRAVTAHQLVSRTQVLTDAEVNISAKVDREAGEAVVWVVARRLQVRERG